MNPENPLIFLIETLLDIYIVIVLLRFIMQLVRADFYNPVSQFIVKATQIPVVILRKFIPGFHGIDLSTLVFVIALIFLKTLLVATLRGISPSIAALLIYTVYDLIQLGFNVFIFAIFAQVILSWINPDPHNPITSLLRSLTNPILLPARKLLPPFGGLDLSPIIALIGLMFVKRVVLYFFQLL